jgi:hypothetical protein
MKEVFAFTKCTKESGVLCKLANSCFQGSDQPLNLDF